MIKIAFFDIDGTLLRFKHKELTKNVSYTLKKLQENGILICMATGRGIMTIPHFEGIEFDVYLTFNGSYVVDNKGNVIRNNPIPKQDVKQICNNLDKMNRPISIASSKFVVANKTPDKDLKEYYEFARVELLVVDNFEKYLEDDVYQIMCAARKPEYTKIIDKTKNSQITAWWDKAIDIIPLNSGKGIAIENVLNYFGFKKEEAIGFGDGRNDIELLESVGTAVAMGNAIDEVKSHADEVCKSVDEDGVYDYCLKHNFFKKL